MPKATIYTVKKTGTWKYYDCYGFLVKKEIYAPQSDTVFRQNYYTNNQIKSEGYLHMIIKDTVLSGDNPRTGEFEEVDKKLEILQKQGEWKYYWGNGDIKKTLFFSKGVSTTSSKYYK